MIVLELKRMRSDRMFWAALFVGIAIMVAHVIMCVVPMSHKPILWQGTNLAAPASVYRYWVGGVNTVYINVFLMLMPILVSVAYSLTYALDMVSGYAQNVITRTSRKQYLVGKYVATFVSGGIVTSVPLLCNFLLSLMFLPMISPAYGHNGIKASVFLSELYYANPLLHVILWLIIYFIYGGVVASIGLAMSHFVSNIFVLGMFPFLICYVISMFDIYVAEIEALKCISCTSLLMMGYNRGTTLAMCLFPLLVGVISFAVYYMKGRKFDAL